jgi:DNA repair exonuclease SbcCD nuclease subunit
MVKVDSSIFGGWDQVFLGHYHAEQKLDYNVEYIGSPLQLNFGEAFQHKHIIVYDTETGEKEYIRNTFSPQHFIVPIAEVEKYALDKNFIRVIVDDIAASDLVEVRSKLLAKHKMGSLEIKPVIKQDTDMGSFLDGKQLLVRSSEMTVRFVDEMEKTLGLGDLEKKKLLEIGQAICERKGEAS